MSVRTVLSSALLLSAVGASVATSGTTATGDFYENTDSTEVLLDVVETYTETIWIAIDAPAESGVLESAVDITLDIDLDGGDPVQITLYNEDGTQVYNELATQDGVYQYHLDNPLYCQFYDAAQDLCITQVSFDVLVPGGFATILGTYEVMAQGDVNNEGDVYIWTQ